MKVHILLITHNAIVIVQSLSHIQIFVKTAVHQAPLSSAISQSLINVMSIELTISNHHILCHSLLLLPSIFPSIGLFSSQSTLGIRWPKYLSFSFRISSSSEYLGLIFFRIDWFDFLAIQGTLKSLFRHHNSKASILWHLAFLMIQLSHPYMTRKTIALTVWTFVGKVMFLVFNMPSKFVIALLPKSKYL